MITVFMFGYGDITGSCRLEVFISLKIMQKEHDHPVPLYKGQLHPSVWVFSSASNIFILSLQHQGNCPNNLIKTS
jgi:hypothetical protein